MGYDKTCECAYCYCNNNGYGGICESHAVCENCVEELSDSSYLSVSRLTHEYCNCGCGMFIKKRVKEGNCYLCTSELTKWNKGYTIMLCSEHLNVNKAVYLITKDEKVHEAHSCRETAKYRMQKLSIERGDLVITKFHLVDLVDYGDNLYITSEGNKITGAYTDICDANIKNNITLKFNQYDTSVVIGIQKVILQHKILFY